MFRLAVACLLLTFCWLNGFASWCLWLVLLVAFALIVLYAFFDCLVVVLVCIG